VHPEEGQRRVGDRVDQVVHQVSTLCGQLVVLAAEGHDADRGVDAGQARESVGL